MVVAVFGCVSECVVWLVYGWVVGEEVSECG